MTDAHHGLGGYDPEAGLLHYEADKPRRLPVPSLLRSLLSEHLDPGYAAAAEERRQRALSGSSHPSGIGHRGWQIAAALTVAVVFAAAVAQTQSLAPGVREAQEVLAGSVRAAQAAVAEATAQRDALGAQVDELQRQQLAGDAAGQRLLADLDTAEAAAALTPVHGPGLTVTVTDPGASPDLSDVSKERVPGSRMVILDRDLQLVVNSLWASGAEAVSVGGVRIGPNATIRQAGGAILVDMNAITSPYVIAAVGPPGRVPDDFDRSPGLLRLRLLEVSYDVGLSVSRGDDLQLPAAESREVTFAAEIG
ncbi:MAG: DUF881 domain-containing protein [Mycobacterium sp.]